jgi:hypothetical protein
MEAIDTSNRFFVGTGPGGGVTVMQPISGRLTKEDAVNLAAWIVAITDSEVEFGLTLEAIRNV